MSMSTKLFPDYNRPCKECGGKPTIFFYKRDGKHHTKLCGPCSLGTPDADKPETWNQWGSEE